MNRIEVFAQHVALPLFMMALGLLALLFLGTLFAMIWGNLGDRP